MSAIKAKQPRAPKLSGHPKLNAAVDRGNLCQERLKSCPPVARAQILTAWKQIIREEFTEIVDLTEDPATLASIDITVAACHDGERQNKIAQ